MLCKSAVNSHKLCWLGQPLHNWIIRSLDGSEKSLLCNLTVTGCVVIFEDSIFFNIFRESQEGSWNQSRIATLYTIQPHDFGVPKGGLHKLFCLKANYSNSFFRFYSLSLNNSDLTSEDYFVGDSYCPCMIINSWFVVIHQ